MKILDSYTKKEYTLKELKNFFTSVKKYEPWNKSKSFQDELCKILITSLKSNNDINIVGLTQKELIQFIDTLKKNTKK